MHESFSSSRWKRPARNGPAQKKSRNGNPAVTAFMNRIEY